MATLSDHRVDRGVPTHLVVVTGLQGTGKSTIADAGAVLLGAPVLSHDWAMSALRPYPPVEDALDHLGPFGRRDVGWSILCSLARSQLRRGISVVLDGMAGAPDIDRCRQVASEEGAGFVVILTECADTTIHRSRIEGRQRDIPNWYELGRDHVQRSRARWQPPGDADLTLSAMDSLESNRDRLAGLLGAVPDP
jgi:predicted kinase